METALHGGLVTEWKRMGGGIRHEGRQIEISGVGRLRSRAERRGGDFGWGTTNRKAKVWCRFGISASDVLLYHNLLLQNDVQDGDRMETGCR